jgi:hypothetical protein
MQNKILNFEPALLSTASNVGLPNLLNSTVTTLTPGGVGFTGTQPYVIVKHIRLVNVLTTVAAFATLYKGATLTSLTTQSFAFSSVSIPAQSYLDWYGQHRFDTADYMIGYSNLQNAVLISMDGEIGLS